MKVLNTELTPPIKRNDCVWPGGGGGWGGGREHGRGPGSVGVGGWGSPFREGESLQKKNSPPLRCDSLSRVAGPGERKENDQVSQRGGCGPRKNCFSASEGGNRPGKGGLGGDEKALTGGGALVRRAACREKKKGGAGRQRLLFIRGGGGAFYLQVRGDGRKKKGKRKKDASSWGWGKHTYDYLGRKGERRNSKSCPAQGKKTLLQK